MHNFAAAELHISLAAEPIFHIGSFAVTNALILGAVGYALVLGIFLYVARRVAAGRHNRLTGIVQWSFEGMLKQVDDVIGDRKLARSIAPLALTIFFLVLITYWISIIPGVGPITVAGVPLLRGLPADLNFTFALAIITIVAVQFYAVKRHGFFGNAHRYLRNPFKDPIGAFEGVLELIGELSRLVALSLRLFGNAFAGEVLLIVIAVLTSYFAAITLPFFMIFELFIGFIQAYVFFILTLIFTSLAVAHHGEEHDSPHDHSAVTHPKQIAAE